MIRAIAPNADLRPFHSSARSASSGRDADRPHAVVAGDRGDQLGVGLDAVGQPDDLDQQGGGGVDRQPGVDVGLDGLQAQLVHHLHRRRHDTRPR